jgi:hypothetical protein
MKTMLPTAQAIITIMATMVTTFHNRVMFSNDHAGTGT